MSGKAKLITWMILATGFLTCTAHAGEIFTGLSTGYKGGLSFRASAGMSSFAQNFPLGIEFAITYSQMNPGDPFPARRVFIANATNGTPEKSGMAWDFRMDFLYNLKFTGPKAVYLYAGPRFSMFDAHFNYVGANEEFDITSHQWGIGAGLKAQFAISQRVDFTLAGGLEYYFSAPIEGHGTTYSPDNLNVNAKENFTYSDASSVVYAPGFQPTVMIGFAYGF